MHAGVFKGLTHIHRLLHAEVLEFDVKNHRLDVTNWWDGKLKKIHLNQLFCDEKWIIPVEFWHVVSFH